MIKNDEDLKRMQESAEKILRSFNEATEEWAKQNHMSEKILSGIRQAYEDHYLELSAKIDKYLQAKK